MVVGATAAVLQGANTATQDIYLWFESLADPRLADAIHAAGGIWTSGAFGMRPPAIGGEAADRFEVVVHMHGLDEYAKEAEVAVEISLEGIPLRLLPWSASSQASAPRVGLATLPNCRRSRRR